MTVIFRPATAADADAIGLLHADSWRRHYRGAYSDEYLDGEVYADRQAVWRERLGVADTSAVTVVAELSDVVVGFAHIVFDHDPTWGAMLDNLHVTYDLKRQSIGSGLMADSARRVLARDLPTSLYLWVLEQNTAAQGFYNARGGECVERRSREPNPGFGLRYVWRDPSALL